MRDRPAGLSKSVIPVNVQKLAPGDFSRPGFRVGRWPFARGGRLYPAGMRMSIRFAGRRHFAPRRLTAWRLKAYYSGGFGGLGV